MKKLKYREKQILLCLTLPSGQKIGVRDFGRTMVMLLLYFFFISKNIWP